MRMKKKKILLTLLLSAAIVASAAACGTSTPSVSVSNQENSANTPSTASAVSQSAVESSNTTLSEVSLNKNDDFDFDELCKNIEINGKKYTFPFSLDDLGEGYSFKNIQYSNIDESKNTFYVYIDVYYYDDVIFAVSIRDIPQEYYKNEQKLKSIPFTWLTQDNWGKLTGMDENTKPITICGIKIGDTDNAVLKKLGEAHEIVYNQYKKDKLGSYTYYRNGNKDEDYVSYAFDENDCVNYISIMHK